VKKRQEKGVTYGPSFRGTKRGEKKKKTIREKKVGR